MNVFIYCSNDQKPHCPHTTALIRLTMEGAQLESMRLRNSGIGGAYDASGEKVDVDVSIRSLSQYLPAPFAVDGFDASGKWGFGQGTLLVVATGDQGTDQTTNLDYRATLVISDGSSSLPTTRTGSDPAGGETLKVPEGISDGAQNLVAKIAGNAATDGAKAKVIEEYLTFDRPTYILQAPFSAGVDVISASLLNDRSGYRIYFATSMAVLAQIEDIPSRVAVGSMGGVPDGDGYKATTDDMHAWLELYFEGLGWVSFEPTKSIGSSSTGENPPQSSSSPDPSVPPSTGAESPKPQPTEPTPTFASSPAPSSGDEAQSIGAKSPGNWGWLLWGLPVLVLLVSPAMAQLLIRGWHPCGGQPSANAVVAMWRELVDTHRDLGREFLADSPVEAAKTMEPGLPAAAAAHLLRVAEVAQCSRFAHETLPVDQLLGRVKLLVRELRNDTPAPRRLLAFLPPVSLWWPRSVGGGKRGRKSRQPFPIHTVGYLQWGWVSCPEELGRETTMVLSEQEQKRLNQLEASLLADGPKSMDTLRGTPQFRVQCRRAALAGVVFMAGLTALVPGVQFQPVIPIIDLVMMLVLAITGIGAWSRVKAREESTRSSGESSHPSSGTDFMNKLEGCWHKRQQGGDLWIVADTRFPPLLGFTVIRYRLGNGLELVLLPGPIAPAVAVNLSSQVGSVDELLGRTDFAHLFEHLIFQGSARVVLGEHMSVIEAAGGNVNTFTSTDRTVYRECMPTEALEIVLWLEADRLRSPAVIQENLDAQRDVVTQEEHQRYDNRPYGDLLAGLVG